MKDITKLLKKLKSHLNITLEKDIDLGENSDKVILVKNQQGRKGVLKIGTTKNSINEIKANIAGYKKMKKIGLDFFIPSLYDSKVQNDYAYIYMEYLGKNFLEQIKSSKDKLKLCEVMLEDLERVYKKSLKKGPLGKQRINFFIREIIDVYTNDISKTVDINQSIRTDLLKIKESEWLKKIKYYCFSNWDFTPDDVYMTKQGVKYSDPHAKIYGIPIIEIASFGGLLRLYGIKDMDRGYKLFKKVALTKVSKLLHLDKKTATKIFYLGRLFQCFMSIKFRFEKNPAQARKIFNEAKIYLKRIV